MWYAVWWITFVVFCFHHINSVRYGDKYINSYLNPRREPFIYLNNNRDKRDNLLQYYTALFQPHYRRRYSSYVNYPIVKHIGRMGFHYMNPHDTAKAVYGCNTNQKFGNEIQQDNSQQLSPVSYSHQVNRILYPFFYKMNQYIDRDPDIYTKCNSQEMYRHEKTFEAPRESQLFGRKVKKRFPFIPKKIEKDVLVQTSPKVISLKQQYSLVLPSKIVISNLNEWHCGRSDEVKSNNVSLSMIYKSVSPKITRTKSIRTNDVNKCNMDSPKGKNKFVDKITCFNSIPKKWAVDFCNKIKNMIQTTTDSMSEEEDLCSYEKKPKKIGKLSTSARSYCQSKRDSLIGQKIHIESRKRNKLNSNEAITSFPSSRIMNSSLANNNHKHVSNYTDGKVIISTVIPKSCYSFTSSLKREREVQTTIAETTPIIFNFDDYWCECHQCSEQGGFHNTHKRRETSYFRNGRNNIGKTKKNNLRKSKHFIKRNNCLPIQEHNLRYFYDNSDIHHRSDSSPIQEKEGVPDEYLYQRDNCEKTTILEEKVTYVPLDVSSEPLKEMNLSIPDQSRYKRRTRKYKADRRRKRKRAFISMSYFNDNKTDKFLRSSFDPIHSKNNYFQDQELKKYKKHRYNTYTHMKINGQNTIKGFYRNGIPLNKYIQKIKKGKKVRNTKDHIKRAFVGEMDSVENCTAICDEFSSLSTKSTHSHKTKSTYSNTKKSTYSHTTYLTVSQTFSTKSIVTDIEAPQVNARTTIITQKVPYIATHIPTRVDKTTHKMVIPDTGNNHPAKLYCEKRHQVNCICHLSGVLFELNNLITQSDDEKLVLNQLANYNCSDYKPLNVNYKLSPELKPRLISNKHKELLVDEKNGPKEIIGETFQELIVRGIPNEGVDFFIFPSTSVEIPCFINNEVQLSPNTADSAVYVWRQGNDKVITGGRITEDLNHKGMLQIIEATLNDSDNYTCTVNYTNPDNEQTISNTFIHSVMEWELLRMWKKEEGGELKQIHSNVNPLFPSYSEIDLKYYEIHI